MKSLTLGTFLVSLACASCFPLYHIPVSLPEPSRKQDDSFQSAQRNVSDAIRNLQSFLQERPQGKEAALARMQLAALLNVQTSRVPPTPVPMANYQQKIQWYVDKVERTKDVTHVTLKIINLSTDQDCAFRAFSSSPLAIIGDDRELYMMTKTPIQLPKAVRLSKYNILGNSTNDDYWVFQGGRTITLEVEFERVPDGVLAGQIQYLKPVGGVTPARFSLTNELQRPGP